MRGWTDLADLGRPDGVCMDEGAKKAPARAVSRHVLCATTQHLSIYSSRNLRCDHPFYFSFVTIQRVNIHQLHLRRASLDSSRIDDLHIQSGICEHWSHAKLGRGLKLNIFIFHIRFSVCQSSRQHLLTWTWQTFLLILLPHFFPACQDGQTLDLLFLSILSCEYGTFPSSPNRLV